MDILKDNLNRRDFIEQLAAIGSAALLYGCSNDSSVTSEYESQPSPTTKIALQKTQDRTEGINKVMQLLDFPGHREFYNEVQWAVQGVDGLVLLVDGKEGPQPATFAFGELIKETGLPFITVFPRET